jgi:acyl-homoserine lactone synthase
MVLVVERAGRPLSDAALRSMFEARKRVFVDLLKWDVPVLNGRYEVDEFDDERATYLIVHGPDREHLASTRLLETTRPHILDTLFPGLCAAPPPKGPDVLEVTRFCLDRALPSWRRIEVRNCLVSALVDYALLRGITTYTGVAEMGWLQQILAFGWRCRPLGLPRLADGKLVGALRIEVTPETPALLAANGIYAEPQLDLLDAREAA